MFKLSEMPVGSPEFNPPEVTNGKIGDLCPVEPDDIFCLASVLFLMVMKSSAFNSTDEQDPYYDRLISDPESFWEIFESINMPSDEFKNLFERMTKLDP